jgi:hypothetical protein
MNDVTEEKYIAHINYGLFSEQEPTRLKYEKPMTVTEIVSVCQTFNAVYHGKELCGTWWIYFFETAGKRMD